MTIHQSLSSSFSLCQVIQQSFDWISTTLTWKYLPAVGWSGFLVIVLYCCSGQKKKAVVSERTVIEAALTRQGCMQPCREYGNRAISPASQDRNTTATAVWKMLSSLITATLQEAEQNIQKTTCARVNSFQRIQKSMCSLLNRNRLWQTITWFRSAVSLSAEIIHHGPVYWSKDKDLVTLKRKKQKKKTKPTPPPKKKKIK